MEFMLAYMKKANFILICKFQGQFLFFFLLWNLFWRNFGWSELLKILEAILKNFINKTWEISSINFFFIELLNVILMEIVRFEFYLKKSSRKTSNFTSVISCSGSWKAFNESSSKTLIQIVNMETAMIIDLMLFLSRVSQGWSNKNNNNVALCVKWN